MKKLMLIINPVAGRGGFKTQFGEAMLVLANGGLRPDLYFTQDRGDATDYAANYASGYDVVACVGGDGTLSEVLAGLMQIKNPPPVGYFPMGTANDIATTLGLPKNDTIGAAKRILSGTPHPFDVGGFGDHGLYRSELCNAAGSEACPRPSCLCAAGGGAARKDRKDPYTH